MRPRARHPAHDQQVTEVEPKALRSPRSAFGGPWLYIVGEPVLCCKHCCFSVLCPPLSSCHWTQLLTNDCLHHSSVLMFSGVTPLGVRGLTTLFWCTAHPCVHFAAVAAPRFPCHVSLLLLLLVCLAPVFLSFVGFVAHVLMLFCALVDDGVGCVLGVKNMKKCFHRGFRPTFGSCVLRMACTTLQRGPYGPRFEVGFCHSPAPATQHKTTWF